MTGENLPITPEARAAVDALLAAPDWVAVYYTMDGPSVSGPFATEQEALQNILDWYTAELGIDEDAGRERYTTTGDEWVTRLQGAGS